MVDSITTMTPPLITLEEHFLAQNTSERTSAMYSEQFKHIPSVEEKLRDLGDVRLKHMDAGHVSLQVISHAPVPGSTGVQESININDQLRAAILKNSSRFAGFATLPMAYPDAAASELERCVNQLGFVGALIDCHVDGKFYDGEDYLPFWSMATELDVPVYIHPTWPSDDMASQFTGNFTDSAAYSLGSSGWGWHNATALHILRLFASGLFDKLPKLKIVIGHFGEMIPFMLERICRLSLRWGEMMRDFKTVYEQNIWITTSGVWSLAPLATILVNTPIDHILYSVDYPFGKNEDGLKWLIELEESGMVTGEQLNMIAYMNAQSLLGLKL